MIKKILTTIILIFLILIILFLPNKILNYKIPKNNFNNKQFSVTNNYNASYNGFLHTEGNLLLTQNNEIIQLRGVSSHGIEWFSSVITKENLETLKNDWGINVFRIAMYTDSYGEGYISNPKQNIEKVYEIIDMCINLDMYVIVDWHILSDNNPQIYENEAINFFNEVSYKYKDIPNIIYEICNEPNQTTVTWEKNIKPYAQKIIPIIRNNAPNSLIIVGTPDWCKTLEPVANNPLNFKNIVYSCHFYSGTHKQELRNSIEYCLEKNIPIFISECGATTANGDGQIYAQEFNTWINYLNAHNISWIYWSFSNKNEGSAILKNNYMENTFKNESYSNNNSNTTSNDINQFLTSSGMFIKNILQSY